MWIKALVVKTLDALGYELRRKRTDGNDHSCVPSDIEVGDVALIQSVLPYTMTSPERVYSLIKSVDYLIEHQVDGDFVECGVWRGGSMLAVALRLKALGVINRKLWLYDTFSGMPAPDLYDYSMRSGLAQDRFQELKFGDDASNWCFASLDDVKNNVARSEYPVENLNFIEGKVEDTIPKQAPDKICLLRLDTDWYKSTKHELENLFPRLVAGGVLIIDDYGHWEGCRKAVDEYFSAHPNQKPLLVRVDYTGRVGIKI